MASGTGGSGSGGYILGVSNPVGTGSSLNFIGNHAYAFSGLYATSSSPADHLKFTTGNHYFIGRLYCNGAVSAGATSGQATTYEIKFNSIAIAMLRTRTSTDDNPSTQYNDILIPPYTEVAVTVVSGGGGSETTSLVLQGRVY
jgi:hypothetical protein